MKLFTGHLPKTQLGLSLIELMVALLISTILLLGVLELFGSSSKTQRSATAVARLQENGRLAMDLIAHEARRTGFYGCDAGLETSVQADFGAEGKFDGDSFPAESLKGSGDKSVIFRYFNSDDGVKKDKCAQNDLKEYYTRFINCGAHLCIRTTNTGASQQVLLNHAQLEKVLYIQPCVDDPNNPASPASPTDEIKSCTYTVNQLPKVAGSAEPSFEAVQKLQVEIRLCADTKAENSSNYCTANSDTKIERSFSSLIELRNRL